MKEKVDTNASRNDGFKSKASHTPADAVASQAVFVFERFVKSRNISIVFPLHTRISTYILWARMRPPVPRRDLASLHKYNFSNTSITKTFHFFEKKKRFYLYEINWIFSCGNVSFTFPHTHVLCSMYLSMSYFIYLFRRSHRYFFA